MASLTYLRLLFACMQTHVIGLSDCFMQALLAMLSLCHLFFVPSLHTWLANHGGGTHSGPACCPLGEAPRV